MSDALPITAAPMTTCYAGKSFERTPDAASAARNLVRDVLLSWDLEQLSDCAVLVVTELVSNAVRHAKGDALRVTVVRHSHQQVRVCVIDKDRTRPRFRPGSLDEESGRGLLLVEAMSSVWGVDVLAGGKRVWAVLEATA